MENGVDWGGPLGLGGIGLLQGAGGMMTPLDTKTDFDGNHFWDRPSIRRRPLVTPWPQPGSPGGCIGGGRSQAGLACR